MFMPFYLKCEMTSRLYEESNVMGPQQPERLPLKYCEDCHHENYVLNFIWPFVNILASFLEHQKAAK